MGATGVSIKAAAISFGFNSRTRVGATIRGGEQNNQPNSFNSRTRVGATWTWTLLCAGNKVSIHAPVWVRHLLDLNCKCSMWFQFTHPCGCDRTGEVETIMETVSIHAPVWVRPIKDDWRIGSIIVSIHAPVWVRLLPSFGETGIKGFNSRTRVGATIKDEGGIDILTVSIHAPVWVRLQAASLARSPKSFNSRTRVGATLITLSPPTTETGFNSRTRVGATADGDSKSTLTPVSIHAPVWVRRPDEYGLSIKHATKVLRQPDARTGCGQA